MMLNKLRNVLFIILLIVTVNGCNMLESIFQAGFTLGVIITVLALALLIWGIVKMVKKFK